MLEMVLAPLALAAVLSLLIDVALFSRWLTKASAVLWRRMRRRRLAPIGQSFAADAPVLVAHFVEANESLSSAPVRPPIDDTPIRRLKDICPSRAKAPSHGVSSAVVSRAQ